MRSLIKLEDIHKTYVSGPIRYEALRGISFEIKKGEFVAIMGPSGSGKSTAMHIIGALDNASKGSYFLNGKNISKYDEDALAEIRNQEIGFIFQAFNLLPRTTVLKNVERPMMYADIEPDERYKRAMHSLELVGLKDKAQNLSNHISGGQIQRVAIARALVMKPSIILADEPTGNLDSAAANEIMQFFKKLNQEGNTIIVVTHENEIASYAKRVIKIKDGLLESDQKNK